MRCATLAMMHWIAGTQPALSATPALPDDVQTFIERRDGCDHFRGEDPYDAERAAFLEEAMRNLCTGTDRELADLKRKYRNRADVQAALAGYDERVEP